MGCMRYHRSCHWTLNLSFLGCISLVSANIISMDTVLFSQGPTGDGQPRFTCQNFVTPDPSCSCPCCPLCLCGWPKELTVWPFFLFLMPAVEMLVEYLFWKFVWEYNTSLVVVFLTATAYYWGLYQRDDWWLKAWAQLSFPGQRCSLVQLPFKPRQTHNQY